MATVMDRSAVTTVGRGRPGAARPSRRPITLADLITAIQDVVGPEDDGLVVATVRHLLGDWAAHGARDTNPSVPTAAPGEGVVAHCDRRGQTPERGGTPVALLPESRSRGERGATGNAADRSPERR